MKRISAYCCSAVVLLMLAASLGRAQNEKAAPQVLTLTTASDSARADVQRAVYLGYSNFAVRATERARRARAADPSFAVARAVFGFTSGNAAEVKEAVAEAAKGSTGELLLTMIWRERQAGRRAAAHALAEAAVQIYPDDPLFAVESIVTSGRDLRQMAVDFRTVGQKFNFAPAFRIESSQLLAAGDTVGALAAAESFAKASTPGAQLAIAHTFQARTALLVNNRAEARLHAAAAIKENPDFSDAYAELAGIDLLEHKYAAAAQNLQQAMQHAVTPNDRLRFRRSLSILMADEGRYADAMRDLAEVMKDAQAANDRTTINIIHRNMGLLAGVMKNAAEAKSHFDAVAPDDNSPLDTHYAATVAYAEAGDVELARKEAEAYAAAAGAQPPAGVQQAIHTLTGIVSFAAGRNEDALGHLAQGFPQGYATIAYQARAQKALGHGAEAKKLKAAIDARTYPLLLIQFPNAVWRSMARKI